jgi:hypothetical protein
MSRVSLALDGSDTYGRRHQKNYSLWEIEHGNAHF